RHADEHGGGQVRLENPPPAVDGQVADGRPVVERRVAVAALLDLPLRGSQLLVLQLELDLVDLELVNEPRDAVAAGRRPSPAFGRDALFGLAPEVRRHTCSACLASHASLRTAWAPGVRALPWCCQSAYRDIYLNRGARQGGAGPHRSTTYSTAG